MRTPGGLTVAILRYWRIRAGSPSRPTAGCGRLHRIASHLSSPVAPGYKRRDDMAWAAASRLITPADTASAPVPPGVMKAEIPEPISQEIGSWATAHRPRRCAEAPVERDEPKSAYFPIFVKKDTRARGRSWRKGRAVSGRIGARPFSRLREKVDFAQQRPDEGRAAARISVAIAAPSPDLASRGHPLPLRGRGESATGRLLPCAPGREPVVGPTRPEAVVGNRRNGRFADLPTVTDSDQSVLNDICDPRR